jgi:hypothetical protein
MAVYTIAMRLEGQPVSMRTDIQIKQIAMLNRNTVRVRQDPSSGNLYTLENTGAIRRVDFNANGTASLTVVYQSSDHGLSAPLGIAFDKNGTLFLVGNESTGQSGTATIVRGVPDSPGSEARTWTVIAKTVPYLFGYTYNHKMSAVEIKELFSAVYAINYTNQGAYSGKSR